MSKLEFKGTKGHWEIVNDRVFKGNITVETKDCDICDVEEVGEETIFNAKLIAAAPDLLKAVEYWLDYRDNYPKQAPIAVHQKRLEEMARLFESSRNKALK